MTIKSQSVAGTKDLDKLMDELLTNHVNNEAIVVVTIAPNQFRVYWRNYGGDDITL